MKINKEIVKNLAPNRGLHDNYLKFYGDKEFTKAQFMGLKNIRHEYKLWVASRLMTKEQNVNMAIEAAESVLPILEDRYPDDKGPRQSIDISKKILKDPDITNVAMAVLMPNFSDNYTDPCCSAVAHAVDYARRSSYYWALDRDDISMYNFCAAANNITALRNASNTHEYGIHEKAIRKLVLKHWKG